MTRIMARHPTPKIFKPKNPKKYIGNPNNIIARSNLERRFFKLFDEREGIKAWASEEMFIEYISPLDNKTHRYFIDVVAKTEKGELFFIEIKCRTECNPPKKPKKSSSNYQKAIDTWKVNNAKWAAAMSFAAKKGGKFLLLNEDHLKNWKA